MGKGVVMGQCWSGLEGLSCKVGDACSRWPHMHGSWYFPRFLFSVGSWTQMNMASLIVLE